MMTDSVYLRRTSQVDYASRSGRVLENVFGMGIYDYTNFCLKMRSADEQASIVDVQSRLKDYIGLS